MKSNYLKSFLSASLIEGIFALVFLFIPPSMEKNAVLFGYSFFRIVAGALVLILLVILSAAIIRGTAKPDRFNRRSTQLDQFFKQDDHLLVTFVVICLIVLIGLAAFIFFASPLAGHLGILVSIYHRMISIVIWLFLCTIQSGILIWISYPEIRQRPEFLNTRCIFQTSLIFIIIFFTFFHWLVLIFQLGIFGALPYWFWQWTNKPVTLWYFLFPLLLLSSLIIIRRIFKKPHKTVQNLILLMALGYLIQVGFGFMAGNGFESIRDRFMRSGHNQYALHACDRPDLYTAISQYEDHYSQDMFLGTKPPGIIAFYLVTQRLSNSILPQPDFEGCYYRLTMFTAIIFPFISILLVGLLFHFSKKILGEARAYIPCILYILFPNVILMHLELDQVLFPLLFLAGVFLIYQTIKHQSFPLAILSGAFIYFCMYFTFALLPLVGLALAWFMLDFWQNRNTRKVSSAFILISGTILGMLLLATVMYFTINYDFILRYNNAMARHRMHKLYEPGFHQIVDALMLNNVEFMDWSGVPVMILLIIGVIKSSLEFIKNRATTFDGLVIAFAAMYIALNFLGQTRGEVGRLWVFMLPVISMIITPFVNNLFKKPRFSIYTIATIQLITTFLLYHFQDSIFM